MISVGIDVSKEKSTVCILKPCNEIVHSPFEINHTEKDLSKLLKLLKSFNEEFRIVMEATGSYHFPLIAFFKTYDLFVAVINPLVMKKYVNTTIRKGKTDKLDSKKIANYGIDYWYHLQNYEVTDEIYPQLQILSRQYSHYIKMKISAKLALTNLLDRTMPGVKDVLYRYSYNMEKDKLCDFAEKFWHFDNITCLSENEFIDIFNDWSINNGYRPNTIKAIQIYSLAKDGITTLNSKSPSTELMITESVRVLKEINKTLDRILSQMILLAKSLKEYNTVRNMDGIGEILAVRIIAEIGDVRRFHSGKALIAYAGIDAPPHQSGNFTATKRNISKRGSASLRKVGYEIMKCIKSVKPISNPIYDFIIKKEVEGKPSKVAKIAGLNKFLRIYYAKVSELLEA